MAEFHKPVRRVGGEIQPHYRPSGRRPLLANEIQIIQCLGLSEDEYWGYLRLREIHEDSKRKEAYELVPDIRAEFVTTAIIINFIIGVALTAASILLAPKPKTPDKQKTPPQLDTESITGRSRFSPQAQFDTLQELALLGSVIPLVYCSVRNDEDTGREAGGVRVNSSLLWSFLTTLGRSQQLRALLLFSYGKIADRPDYDGYAIGDAKLNTYAEGKAKVFFRTNGGRFNQSVSPDNAYGRGEMQDLVGGATRDPFAIEWGNSGAIEKYFSGSRSPGTGAQFGNYGCMPNGNGYRPNYELVLIPDDADQDIRDDQRTKRNKNNNSWPRYCYIFSPPQIERFNEVVAKGTIVSYIIDAGEVNPDAYQPWGADDIRQATNAVRFDADANLIVGETYMIGTGYGVCVRKSSQPFIPGVNPVAVDFRLTTNATLDYTTFRSKYQANTLTVQRLALGVVSNNRSCNRTDLIIKSVVWRRIQGFPNVNSQPDNSVLRRYEEDNGSITLGQMVLYNKRMSFFALQYRKPGESNWKTMTGETGFCVEGRTPQAAYNMISIYHPKTAQYEFQLAPLAGNAVKRFWIDRQFYFLQAPSLYDDGTQMPTVNVFTYNDASEGSFSIYYTGQEKLFTLSQSSNGEWVVGGNPSPNVVTSANNFRYGDACEDYVVFDAEELSNENQPEHEVVAINEILQNFEPPEYDKLAYAGLRLNSGTEWTTFGEFSAYFKVGIEVEKLTYSGTANTNLFPEIAYNLLTNTDYGVGETVGASQVDRDECAVATDFCFANKFFWDGVIGTKLNIRDFIFENASYCLLQFRIKGGRFSLYPDVPFDTGTGKIKPDQVIQPKAMFTDSNIANIKVSFLSAEERQLFKATVLWREDEVNGFPQTRTVVVRLSDSAGGSDLDPEETFDISGFCTSEYHAITFAKYALKLRKLVDHGIIFDTTPQEAMNLEPGEYFAVATTVQHSQYGADRLRLGNGSIDSNGNVTGLDLTDGTHYIQYWRPGTEGIVEAEITVIGNNISDTTYRGIIFALSRNGTGSRMYKVESLNYAEDGLVQLAGSFVPLNSAGRMETIQWPDRDFVITRA